MKSRPEALIAIRRRFIARGYPRLVVLVFISLSGLAALGFSTALFRLGVEHMGYRYLAATAVGYGVFMLLLALWVELQRPSGSRGDFDVVDLPGGGLPDAGGTGVEFSGGSSGGAGASASWGSADVSKIDVDVGGVDADEAWPVVIAVAVAAIVLLGGVIALFYVVYYAPLLLAEVALDAALVTGIYRKLRKQDTGHWLGSAIRHTWKPAVIIALCLFVVGTVIQWAAPSARTIGDVFR
ncbi:MAG TPA: hypothetical protein VJ691_12890 [Vicinamibacterales bacterium]|nr:hypothetical protein [Vicinamibacterales bacterium]